MKQIPNSQKQKKFVETTTVFFLFKMHNEKKIRVHLGFCSAHSKEMFSHVAHLAVCHTLSSAVASITNCCFILAALPLPARTT